MRKHRMLFAALLGGMLSGAASAATVNQFTSGDQQLPAAAGDAAGNSVIAWDSFGQDGSLSGIYARRLDSAGNPLGAEFRVNTRTDNRQTNPAVAMNADGRFVVAWNSNGVNGVGLGFANRVRTEMKRGNVPWSIRRRIFGAILKGWSFRPPIVQV